MRFEAPRSNTCLSGKSPTACVMSQHWPWRTGTRPKDTEPVQASENSTSVECFCGLSVVTLQASKHMHVGSPVNSIMLAQIFTVGKGPTALVLCMLWLDPSQIDSFCHMARRGEEALHTSNSHLPKKLPTSSKNHQPPTQKNKLVFSHTSSSVHSKNKNCRSGGRRPPYPPRVFRCPASMGFSSAADSVDPWLPGAVEARFPRRPWQPKCRKTPNFLSCWLGGQKQLVVFGCWLIIVGWLLVVGCWLVGC